MDEKQREERDKLIDEIKKKSEEANEAMREGKGRLKLETPILSRDQKIEEVIYDFTKLTGMDYTSAMDIDQSSAACFPYLLQAGTGSFCKSS